MRVLFGFLVDPRGRTDRIGYVFGMFGLFLWLLVLTTLVRVQLDFTGSGVLIDAFWKGDVGEFRRLLLLPEISIHPLVSCLIVALYLLALWNFLSMTARRLQDMGRPGIYAAATLVVGVQAAVLLLAILPGDRDENIYGPAPKRRFQPGGEPGVTGPNTL
jgi:uncharacterized membrane protein YhaH (DUF805 family)